MKSKMNLAILYSSALVFGLMSLVLDVQAQNNAPSAAITSDNIESLGDNSGTNAIRTFDDRYRGVRGTPFLFEDWTLGTLFLDDSTEVSNVKLNLDIANNRLYVRSNDQVVLLSKDRVRYIRFLADFTLFTNSKVAGLSLEGDPYIQVLEEGKNKLYAIRNKKYIEADYRGAYSSGQKYDEYRDADSEYVLAREDGEVKTFKLKKKDIFEIFPVSEADLKEIIKENDVNIKSEKGLTNLVIYHNNDVF